MARTAFESIARQIRDDIVYRPALPPERTAALYAGWQAAVRQVLAQ